MIEKKISLIKIIKLWLQVFLYSVGIETIYFLLKKVDFKVYIRFFFPITFNKYWFFSSYILLYLLIPLINKVLTNLDRISYKKILQISTFVLVIWFSIAYQSAVFSLNDTLSAVLVFCYLYTLGGYIKKYGITLLDKCSFRKIFIITLISFVFFELMLILANSLSYRISFFKPFVMYYNRQNSIFVVTLSTLLFYLFKTLDIKNIKFINTISKTTFGIYLIQSHSLFGGKLLYKYLLHSTNYYDDKRLLIGDGNLNNIMFVLGVCKILGLDYYKAKDVISNFKGLKYRMEYIGKYHDINFYNDTIATIPEATINAINSIKNVDTLILGGMDRGINYDKLILFLNNSTINNFICMPDTGNYIGNKLINKNIFYVDNLEDAVDISLKCTLKDKSCLLSPAAASYNKYKNFEEKGLIFENIVKSIKN